MTAIGAVNASPPAAAGRQPAPPLWRESLWALDWLSLRLSPVYRGIGVPRGDGSPVILVPGFMGTDLYLSELYFWLRRIGYRPYMSGIGINAECPGRLAGRLIRTMERVRAESGRPARLIGHSLGGIIGRVACAQRPELASQIIYFGSPIRALQAHPVIVTLVRLAVQMPVAEGDGRCFTAQCGCGFAETLAGPLPASIRRAAVYSRDDGVVDWHDSVEDEPSLNHEVGGTHLGLVFNPRAYRVLGGLLAASSDGAGRG